MGDTGTPAGTGAPVSRRTARQSGFGSPFVASWRTRNVLLLLIRRELKVRYASSALGYFWTILDPLLTCLVYGLVFGLLIPRTSREYAPYLVFLIAGQLPWQAISNSVTDSSRAIKRERKLVASVSLPRELWVLKVVGAKMCEFVLSVPVLLFFMLVLHKGFYWPNIWMVVPALLLMVTVLVGLGLLLAPLTVMLEDLERVIRIAMRLLFYFSPILYAPHEILRHVPVGYRWMYYLNPFAGIIDLFRGTIYAHGLPPWLYIGVSSSVCVVALVLGLFVFRRLEGAVLKEI